jgi:hypothetical protein
MISNKDIISLNYEFYDENISYCGLWAGNSYRTKLNIHKLLPFNKFCFLHDKGYYLIAQNFKSMSFKEVLQTKAIIDDIFYKNMITQAEQEKSVSKLMTAKSFYFIIKVFTPIYFLGWFFYKK